MHAALPLTVCCRLQPSPPAFKAAWGELQRQGTQLAIRSYELGVFFGPGSLSPGKGHREPVGCASAALTGRLCCPRCGHDRADPNEPLFSCTPEEPLFASAPVRNVTPPAQVPATPETAAAAPWLAVPLPYSLPPVPYRPADRPWAIDGVYTQPDAYGRRWPLASLSDDELAD